jgi:hypothetical protein
MSVHDTDRYVSLAYWNKFFNEDDWDHLMANDKKLQDLLEDLDALAADAVNFYLNNDRVPLLDESEEA